MTGKRLSLVSGAWLFALFFAPSGASAQTNPDLQTAATYSILAGTEVTNTGVTTINGDVGISPGSAGAGLNHPGFGTVVHGGAMHDADAQALTAQGHKNAAFGNLGGQGCTVTYAGAFKELGGLSLPPGVYCADRFFLSGTLTLAGTAADVWIFKSSADLIVSGGAAASVVGPSCNIWWRLVSSASMDANSTLRGNILADTSITLAAGAILGGRALARTGNVTLSSNTVSACGAQSSPGPGGGGTPTPTPIPSPRPNVCATTQPDLFLTKRHTDLFVVGTNANYSISVLNNGVTPSGTITVTDTLPNGLAFVSAAGNTWTCSAAGQIVTCTTANPIPGPITLTVRPQAAAVPGVINNALVSGGGDCDVTNNAVNDITLVAAQVVPSPTPAVCTTTAPDLQIAKSHTGQFVVGATATYAISLSNRGVASSGPITIIDTLPPGLTFVSATGSTWSCAAVGQVVTCTTTQSAAAGSNYPGTVTIAVRSEPSAPPSVTNVAAVTGGGDCDLTNNVTADVTAVLAAVPTLSEWAFITLTVLLAAAGVVALRRRRAV